MTMELIINDEALKVMHNIKAEAKADQPPAVIIYSDQHRS